MLQDIVCSASSNFFFKKKSPCSVIPIERHNKKIQTNTKWKVKENKKVESLICLYVIFFL